LAAVEMDGSQKTAQAFGHVVFRKKGEKGSLEET